MSIESSTVIRAAAILTGSDTEDFTSDFDLRNTVDGELCIDLSFTKGSLTNCTVAIYAGSAATPTAPVAVFAGAGTVTGGEGTVAGALAPLTEVLTATATRIYPLSLKGCRYMRVGLTGSGTATSSSATVTARHVSYNTLADTDGASRIS